MTIETDASKVSPQTHIFIGMYREPWEIVMARIGQRMDTSDWGWEQERQRWAAGQFDIPQYQVIDGRNGVPVSRDPVGMTLHGMRLLKISRRIRSHASCLRDPVYAREKKKMLQIAADLREMARRV